MENGTWSNQEMSTLTIDNLLEAHNLINPRPKFPAVVWYRESKFIPDGNHFFHIDGPLGGMIVFKPENKVMVEEFFGFLDIPIKPIESRTFDWCYAYKLARYGYEDKKDKSYDAFWKMIHNIGKNS